MWGRMRNTESLGRAQGGGGGGGLVVSNKISIKKIVQIRSVKNKISVLSWDVFSVFSGFCRIQILII